MLADAGSIPAASTRHPYKSSTYGCFFCFPIQNTNQSKTLLFTLLGGGWLALAYPKSKPIYPPCWRFFNSLHGTLVQIRVWELNRETKVTASAAYSQHISRLLAPVRQTKTAPSRAL
ncbi:hypothetical protein EI168_07725 [Halomonas sp. FME1]|uniref:Uncharacterized protein n=1 Tax=Halomonas casei TaxID=2742613 RepID=A0ABR9F0M1_9GAMM|nr:MULTISPECIES: hypothetical protein [Halomonas]MBE0399998.1 hypothetical protein [Halomonas casei]